MVGINKAPFEFMFDELDGTDLRTKAMFGCLAVYIGNKIMFIQRSKGDPPEDDGIWIATTIEHHDSLKKEFPSLRSIRVFGPGVTGWQVLPQEDDDFESSVVRVCALARAGDPRIGKIPKAKIKTKKKTKKKKKKKSLKNSKKRPLRRSKRRKIKD